MVMAKTVYERFREKVVFDNETGCWLWNGAKKESGYGTFFDGKVVTAHRWSYAYHIGPIPAGKHLDHLCRVRNCVNPLHMEPVTKKENDLRGQSPLAINARKTHCDNGHEFTPENTYVYPGGGRKCRRCRTDQMIKYNREARPYTKRGKAAKAQEG